MRIFVSYSSRYRDICERLRLALEAGGRHRVFVDRSELTPGMPFDDTLRKGIEDCDLLLYLISPESVAAGCYALAELEIAKKHWRLPAGHVLPVKVAPTPNDAIPAFLRAVTILEPPGDVVAETMAAVEAIRPSRRRGRALALLSAAILLAAALAAAGYLIWQRQRADVAQLAAMTAAAQQLCESGNAALAWQRYGELVARYSDRQPLRQAREDCGMRWLRESRVRDGQQTFTDIADRVVPALAEGAVLARGQRAADLLAHMGWADFLRIRDGAGGLDPEARYLQALAQDRSNVFAHAMWGHYLIVRHGPIEDAAAHFAAALASGRERAYVRHLQIAALLYYRDKAGEIEAARVAGDMRRNGEAVDADMRERFWSVYADALLSPDRRNDFLAALHQDGSAETFRWLFPENEVRSDRSVQWRFFLALLEEASGQRAIARSRFEALRDDLKRGRSPGSMLDESLSAIKRLQSP